MWCSKSVLKNLVFEFSPETRSVVPKYQKWTYYEGKKFELLNPFLILKKTLMCVNACKYFFLKTEKYLKHLKKNKA